MTQQTFLTPTPAGEWLPQFMRPAPSYDVVAVYGSESRPAAREESHPERVSLLGAGSLQPGTRTEAKSGNEAAIEMAPLHVVSILLVVLYCWMIYAFRGQAAACLAGLVRLRGGEESDLHRRRLYDKFLSAAATLGAVAMGVIAGKIAVWLLSPGGIAASGGVAGVGIAAALRELAYRAAEMVGISPGVVVEWIPAGVALSVAVAAVCIAGLQTGVIRVAGVLTLSRSFAESVSRWKWSCAGALSLAIVPLAVVFTPGGSVPAEVLAWCAVGAVATIGVLFALHTARVFVKQNVSLLVWFLYLCGVEFFPISLVGLIVLKSI